VRGPLADLLKVEERFRPALEAVLGGMMDGIVVDSLGSVLDLVTELADNRIGRARFCIENSGSASDNQLGAGHPGCLGILSSHVRVEDAQRVLVERLLGSTYVFESTDDALSFITDRSKEDTFDAVTLSGVYINVRTGVYFSGPAGDEVTLLQRADEIEKLRDAIAILEDETEELQRDCEAARSAKDALHEKIRGLDRDVPIARESLLKSREELQEIDRTFIMKKEKCALMLESLGEMEESRGEILSKLEESRLSLQLSRDGTELPGSSELETELLTIQNKRTEIDAALTDKKVEIASLQGELEKRKEEIRGINEMQEQFNNIIEQRRDEISRSREESSGLETSIGVERNGVKHLLEREKSLEKELDDIFGALEVRRGEVSALEKELKAKQSEREKILSRESEVRITLSSIETRMTDLIDRAREVFDEDLGCYLDGTEIPLTEEDSRITKEMLEKEKRTLESFGPVNLAAVDEYEEKKARLDFLVSQKEDLVNAKGELEEAIRKINKRARKRFIDTFEIVSKYFSETFQVLFEGGEARLMLSESSDPLEADIIITARPVGKRLQDISLLSGGERALTALALLFALYKAKPSPFCIFDEVDAPLDDANIKRFVNMLKTFQRDTQFIIITHNKRTMEIADVLYGITMEEKGISRIVSVDIADVERVMSKREPAAGTLVEAPVSSN
jgi:chromosome segregation protein